MGLSAPVYSACASIQCMQTLVCVLVYWNFLREVRLDGWGSDGPKGPTLGQYVSAWVKPKGLNPISRKKYLISNLIICFRFPRASMRYYTVCGQL